jgi:hypothetical protein
MGKLEHKLDVIYLIVTNYVMVQFTQFSGSHIPVKPWFVNSGTCNTVCKGGGGEHSVWDCSWKQKGSKNPYIVNNCSLCKHFHATFDLMLLLSVKCPIVFIFKEENCFNCFHLHNL